MSVFETESQKFGNLILARKIGQRILIGDGIRVTVHEIDGRVVKIGIEAHRDVKILREELASDEPVSQI